MKLTKEEKFNEAVLNDKVIKEINNRLFKLYQLVIPHVYLDENNEEKTIWYDSYNNPQIKYLEERKEKRINEIKRFYQP